MMLKGRGIIARFFLCVSACVLFTFGGAGVAQAYTVTYDGCNGNSWNSSDPTNAAQLPSDCFDVLGPCANYYAWGCSVDGGGYHIISFGQSLSSYLTGDMTCSLLQRPISPRFRITYHGGNCATPSNPTQSSPSVVENVQDGSVSYTIKSPENLSSQNLANLYSGLDNCVSFNGYYYYGHNTAFPCNGSNCGSFVPADQASGVSEGCIYNIDLYMTCDWTEYSVVYHGCDGTVDQNSAVIYNGSFNVLPYEDTGLSSTGYTFQSWNTAADGSGTTYSANDSYTMNNCAVSGTTIDLYAMCTLDICPITLDPNNGTGVREGGDSSSSTNNTKTIYSQYADGAYKTNTNGVLSDKMTSQSGLGDTPPSPALGIPVGRNVTWTFDAQTNAPINPLTGVQYSVTNPANIVKQRGFAGYYASQMPISGYTPVTWLPQHVQDKYIDEDGYITNYGQSAAESVAQNNGSCPATTWYAQYDCAASDPIPAVSLDGYIASQWRSYGGNVGVVVADSGTTPKMCVDHNLRVTWTANTYTITYAPGVIGGNSVSKSVNFDANTYTDNTALAAITNPFTVPTGYIFTGWASNYDVGTGTPTTNPMTSYDEGDSLGYYKVVGSTTMTAQWDCDTGYTWVNGECVIAGYTITLDQQGADTSSVPTTLYTTAGVGAYLESARTNLMSTSANNITIPSKTAHTTTYNANAPQNTSVSAPGNSVTTWTFNGFYESTADSSAQYIDNAGLITGGGDTTAKSLASDDTWYAKWTANCVNVQSGPTAPTGYSFVGWYKNAAGTGNAVTQVCADDDFDTLYAKWDCATNYHWNSGNTECVQDVVNLQWHPKGGTLGNSSPAYCVYNTIDGINGITQPSKEGYTFNGWLVMGWDECGAGMVLNDSLIDKYIRSVNGECYKNEALYSETCEDLSGNQWKSTFNSGTLYGEAKCNDSNADSDDNQTGSFCWCKLTGYTPSGGAFCPLVSFDWLYMTSFNNSASVCNNPVYGCAEYCLRNIKYLYRQRQ